MTLSFESFDGGGPEFEVFLDNADIVSYTVGRKYAKPDHAVMTGAGYTVTFTFSGLRPGETGMKIEQRSPIAENLDIRYNVRVDANLQVSIRKISEEPIF